MGTPMQQSEARGGAMARALPRSGGPDFEDWLAAREGALQRTAHLLTGDVHSAQDLVQTTLAKLYLRWDRVRSSRQHRRLRPHGPGQRVPLLLASRGSTRRSWSSRPSRTDRPPRRRRTTAAATRCGSFVCSLPPKQRTVVVLRFYEQLTEAEIADLMGISVGTVKSQSSRALAALRARLPDHPEISGEEAGR